MTVLASSAFMESKMRFYRARVTTPNDDHGIIHFLVEEDSGRSIEKVAFDILDAPFLSHDSTLRCTKWWTMRT